MRKLFTALLSAATLSAAAAAPLQADAPDRLFIRPWFEREPLVRIGPGPYPIPVESAERSLLELGRQLISGMVYGWQFVYEPGDRARRVQERFVLTPIAQVPWGSTRLRVTETQEEDTRLWGRISYELSAEESRRRQSWDSATTDLSTGQGTAAIQEGDAGRQQSLEAAIRDAIRRSLDGRYVNKPREVTGDVILWNDPVVMARAGTWTTSVTVKLLVRDVVPYRIF